VSLTYIPQPGDIGLTQIKGSVGFGIRLGQWMNGDGFADYEHAFVHVGRPHGEAWDMIVEAEPGGARLVALDEYDLSRVRWLKCPDQCRADVAAAALGFIGVPYSFLDYGYLAVRRFHIPAPHLKALIRTSKHQICSQLSDAAANLGRWHLFSDNRWEGDVTPGDLNRLWLEQQEADE